MVTIQPDAVSSDELSQLPLFDGLGPDVLEEVAPHAARISYEPADRIVTQGAEGDYFYVIVSGEVQVLREEDGAQRLLGYLGKGEFFGEASLLAQEPRNSSVEGVTAGELLRFDADGFKIIAGSSGSGLTERIRRVTETRSAVGSFSFRGQRPDEICLALQRRHSYALFESVVPPVVTAIVMSLGLTILVDQGYLDLGGILVVGAVLALLLTFWMVWLIYDWWNDQYIVTNERVIEIERVLLISEKRVEAPIGQIQSVRLSTPSLLGNLFGYQDLLIQTGSSSGTLRFTAVANGEELREKVLQASSATRARGTSTKKKEIQEELRQYLGDAPVGQPPVATDVVDELPPPAYGFGTGELLRRVLNYIVPHVEEHRQGAILWRRHPYILIRGIILPLLVFLLIVPMSILAIFSVSPVDWVLQFPVGLLLLILFNVASFIWLVWSYEDWHNDYYAVTDTQIIDRNSLPLGIREVKITGPFEAIQDAQVDISGFFHVLLSMGDVLVSTSGQGSAFKFDSMYRPREVQAEIMRRLGAYRERARQRQVEQQRRELATWFSAYRDLEDKPDGGRTPA